MSPRRKKIREMTIAEMVMLLRSTEGADYDKIEDAILQRLEKHEDALQTLAEDLDVIGTDLCGENET